MHRIITIAVLIVATVATAHADDRKRHESKRHESHNYIIERQQAGQVSGVPILRRIHRQARDRHLPRRLNVREEQLRRLRQALNRAAPHRGSRQNRFDWLPCGGR